jgi:hypothetical protein
MLRTYQSHGGAAPLCGLTGATLIAEAVANTRAGAVVKRLDAMIEAMRRDGTLPEFNARYKAGTPAALELGEGFMGFGIAMERLSR